MCGKEITIRGIRFLFSYALSSSPSLAFTARFKGGSFAHYPYGCYDRKVIRAYETTKTISGGRKKDLLAFDFKSMHDVVMCDFGSTPHGIDAKDIEHELPRNDASTTVCVLRCPWNHDKRCSMQMKFNILFPRPYASISFDAVELNDNITRVKVFLETVAWLKPIFEPSSNFPLKNMGNV